VVLLSQFLSAVVQNFITQLAALADFAKPEIQRGNMTAFEYAI